MKINRGNYRWVYLPNNTKNYFLWKSFFKVKHIFSLSLPKNVWSPLIICLLAPRVHSHMVEIAKRVESAPRVNNSEGNGESLKFNEFLSHFIL